MAIAGASAQSQTYVLDKGWEFSQAGSNEWMSARVPGTVHQDLLDHGRLPDPFYGMNEQKVQWVEKEDWLYRTVFTVTADQLKSDAAWLTFEGLDTYADVYLNGSLLLKADNMFVGHKLAVYFALLDVGDTVMGMDLSQGGHLTHGSPVNMSGKNYHFVSYGVNEDGVIDYAALEKQVKTVRPKLIVAGASAYPRAIDFEKLAEIAHGYGAYLMVDMAHIAGLVAGGYHQSPVPYADVVTTTTHKTLRGPRGGLILTNNAVLSKRINSAVFPGTQGGPLEHVIAAKAVCFGEALKPEFKEYARKIVENAQAMAAELQARGVKLVSGGTDNHLMLLDLREEECTGKELETRLDSVHITANKNTVPGETRSPFVTSGVRLGTPAVTTRGMGPAEMEIIADCIADCIWHYDEKRDDISARVLALTKAFPLYE